MELERDEVVVPERESVSEFCFIVEVIWKATDTPTEVATLKILAMEAGEACVRVQRGSVDILEPFPLCTSSYTGQGPSLSQPGGGARELSCVSSPVLCLCPGFFAPSSCCHLDAACCRCP